MAIQWQDCDRKEDWKSLLARRLGKSTPAGNVFMFTDKLNSFFECMSTTKKRWEKKQLGLYVVEIEGRIDLEQPTPFIDQVYLGCTQRESTTKGSYCHNQQTWKIGKSNLGSTT